MEIDPVFLTAGLVQIRWSAMFAAAGIFIGVVSARSWARAAGLSESSALPAILAIIAGIFAGRVAVLFERPEILRRGWGFALLISQGGLSLPAAAFGGLVLLAGWALVNRQAVWMVLGAAGPAVLLGEAVAAAGLFVVGAPAGIQLPSPWGVVFTQVESAVPPTLLGRPVAPVSLGAALWSAAAFGLLWVGWHKLRSADRLLYASLAFGLGHLVLGYLRLDPPSTLGLRQDQLFGLLWLVFGAAGLIFAGRTPANQVRQPGGQRPALDPPHETAATTT